METKINKASSLLSEIGYKELNINYDGKNIIINQDKYLYSDISNILCVVEYYDSFRIKQENDLKNSNNDLNDFIALFNQENEVEIEIDAIYLLVRNRQYQEKRYLVGIFPNDDDELIKCKNKGDGLARGMIEYCNQLYELEKNSNSRDEIENNPLEDLFKQLLSDNSSKNEIQKVKPQNNLVKAKQEYIVTAGMYFDQINYLSGWYDIQVLAGNGYLECFSDNNSKKIFFDINDELCQEYRNLYLDDKSSIQLNTGIKLKLIYLGDSPK